MQPEVQSAIPIGRSQKRLLFLFSGLFKPALAPNKIIFVRDCGMVFSVFPFWTLLVYRSSFFKVLTSVHGLVETKLSSTLIMRE
ncbi:hypothetical protein RvY_00621 [Ramazzottius varieornatus]|uniref:Uncharacterized protein n=1 Tax=Ramazzottius varieornatus TaxID=947166 RepID=A0A1D1UHG1_RAMVA|nr:hypothetical protein RvY_00621 [Ramazzottius varieornatus]